MDDEAAGSLTEKKVHGVELLKGKFLHAFRDEVCLPDGQLAKREYFVHPGAVMVIPLIEDQDGQLHVVLERQFRYPIGKVMIEFPAGKLDESEDRFHCAQRELREETGYTALEWAHAGVLHPAIAYCTEAIDIWFARGLVPGLSQLDEGEFLEVFTATPTQVLDWCRDGVITDGKTLSATLWLQNVIAGTWTLNWQSANPAH